MVNFGGERADFLSQITVFGTESIQLVSEAAIVLIMELVGDNADLVLFGVKLALVFVDEAA